MPPRTHPPVFLSYNRSDTEVARWVSRVIEPLLVQRLSHEANLPDPLLSVFRDEQSIPPGEDWPDALQQALKASVVMVAVFSPQYFTRPWCIAEFETMLARQRRTGVPCILPLRFSDGDFFPDHARRLEWIDMEHWDNVRTHKVAPKALREAIKRLCSEIHSLLQNPPDDPSWTFIVPKPDPAAFLDHKPAFGDLP